MTRKTKSAAGLKPAAAAGCTAALDALFQPFNSGDAPGLVVGVAQHGALLYRRGFGMASIEHAVANTPATRMRIGSTSKHFTCLAALLLAEEGRLDLDAPATIHLPELKTQQGVPTLRQMMDHTSGLRCYLDLLMLVGGLAVHPVGRAFEMQTRQTAVNFAPGEGQIYCNGGYHLLSVAIQRASGVPLAQFMRERLFQPLGMLGTELAPSDMTILPGMATLHLALPPAVAKAAGGGYRRGIFMQEDVLGEGGIVSTVDDMLAWTAHLRRAVGGQPQLGNADTWQQMVTPACLNNGQPTPYALGLMVTEHRGAATLQHAGGVVGGACQMVTVPEYGLDLILMTNGPAANPVQLAKQIIDVVLAAQLKRPPPKPVSLRSYKHLDGAQYQARRTGLRFGFAAAGKQLGISLFGPPAVPLLVDDGDTLRLRFEDAVLGHFAWSKGDLAPGTDGAAPATLAFTDAGVPDQLDLLPSTPPDTLKAGRALLGRYHCEDLGAAATIAVEGSQLVLRLSGDYGQNALALTAVSADAFIARALDPLNPSALGLTVCRQRRQVVGVKLSSGRARRLHFERLPH